MSEPLVAAALAARRNAYAPYSKFLVGAAVATRDGRVFAGVNVENASYGLTVCAERNAIAAAVAAGVAPQDIVALAVAADAEAATPPCGACRQVIAEFMGKGDPITLHNVRDGRSLHTTLEALLPLAFDATSFARR